MNHFKNIKKLFYYTCNIYEYCPIEDSISKKTYFEKVLIYENIPCKISYINTSSINYLNKGEFNNKPLQYMKLFLQKDINVSSGSLVTIFRDGEEIGTFTNSGEAKIYTYHQEISFSIKEEFS